MILGFLKWLLILALCVLGTILLLKGMGVGIDAIDLPDMHVSAIPAGAVVFLLAVALARYWKVSRTVTTREEGTTESGFPYFKERTERIEVSRKVGADIERRDL